MMAQYASQNQPDDTPVGHITQMKEIKFYYTWTIDNFKIHNAMIKSPCFSVKENDNIKWCLNVYPKGCNEDSKDYISVHLVLILCEKIKVTASYAFSILNSEKIQTYVKKSQTRQFTRGAGYGDPKFIGRYDLLDPSKGFLIEDRLMICCEVLLDEDSVGISRQGDLVQVSNPRGSVADDIGKLFEETTLWDITLVTEGKEIRAHKAILAARSDVFAAMFLHDMQEQKLSRVDITDVDHDTLTKMLRYIYTGHTPNLDKKAAELLVAADKYALDKLKVMCEESLCRNLSVETAAGNLILADLHSVKQLKEQSIAFINSRHVGMVMATEGWKKMTSTHPHLVAELFCKMTVLLQKYLPISSKGMEIKDDKAKSEATFRFVVQNFKNLENQVLSPSFYAHNLPWKILVTPEHAPDKQTKTLSLYLVCNGERDSSSWSCYVTVEFKLLSHKPGTEPFVKMFQGLFCCNEDNWGYDNFMVWSDVLDPVNGYVKDDAITLEVHVMAKSPDGVSRDSTKQTACVDMIAQTSAESSQQDDTPVGQWSLTQTRDVKCNYTWTIDNFKLHCEETVTVEMITSPCFSVEANDDIKWCLEVYPKDCNEESSEYVSVFLKLVSCEKSEVIASYAFSILDCQYIQTNVKKLQTKHFKQGTNYGYPKFIRISRILDQSNGLLTEGKLTICCEVSVKVDTVDISGQGDLVQVKNPRRCVSDAIGKLFDNTTLSDVTLVVGGKEIRAHKLILSARSDVFAAIFQHDMQEQKQSRVDITDVDHDTLTEMLRYIYTGRTPNLDKMAADLLVAADKYALDNLKMMCEESLCRNLSIETAADNLVWADLHSVKRLKKHTIAFINSRHVGMVMATEGWKKMTSTHPHLVAELFSEMTVLLQKHLPIYGNDCANFRRKLTARRYARRSMESHSDERREM